MSGEGRGWGTASKQTIYLPIGGEGVRKGEGDRKNRGVPPLVERAVFQLTLDFLQDLRFMLRNGPWLWVRGCIQDKKRRICRARFCGSMKNLRFAGQNRSMMAYRLWGSSFISR